MDRREFLNLPLALAACVGSTGELFAQDALSRNASNGDAALRAAPKVLGAAEVGCILVAELGVWSVRRKPDFPVLLRQWQWRRNDVAIPGAVEPTYVISPDDLGSSLTFVETVTGPDGSAQAASEPTPKVARSARKKVDLTRLGLKSSSTRGSVHSGERRLVVQSPEGFSVGDQIIVEIGAEPGGGRRGTRGVGGSWPSLSFADARVRDNAAPQIENTYCWIESDGSVHRFSKGKWIAHDEKDYYWSKAQPTALVATITAIDGKSLTLSKPAQATATEAAVYFDNHPAMTKLIDASGPAGHRNTLDLTHAVIPAGTFAFSDLLEAKSVNGLSIAGAGRDQTILKSPRGVPSISLRFMSAQDCHVRDLHLLGNVRDDGYGLKWRNDTSINRGWSATQALYFTRCGYGSVRDLRVTNPWTNAVGTQSSSNIWARDVECLSEGHRVYIQWMFQWADSRGGGAIDCSVKSKFMTGGFEAFRSTGVIFIRPKGVNAAFAMNSSGDWLIDEAHLVVKPNSQMTELSFDHRKSIVDINSNIQPPNPAITMGGELRNPVIVQEGYMNAQRQTFTGVIIGPNNPNVLVSGGYPENPRQGGLIEAPDYGLLGGLGPRGVACDGDAVIRGIRVVGSPRRPPGNQLNSINFANASKGLGTVVDCVADLILAAHQKGNQTNISYLMSQSPKLRRK